MSFGLSEQEKALITGIFERYPNIEQVKIFGSRAKGNFRSNSDIDLVLWGQISISQLARIAGELDELPLPYTFDIKVYEKIRRQSLSEHIHRVGKTFYERRRLFCK